MLASCFVPRRIALRVIAEYPVRIAFQSGPLSGILCHGTKNDFAQRWREAGNKRAQWHRSVIRYLEANGGCAIALKWPVTANHLVENHPKGEQVSTPVHFVPTQLFGSHIGWAPKYSSGQCEMALIEFRYAKIGDLSVTF
jgi:hypothetical protein